MDAEVRAFNGASKWPVHIADLISDDHRLVGHLKELPKLCCGQLAAAVQIVLFQPLRPQGGRGAEPGLVEQI